MTKKKEVKPIPAIFPPGKVIDMKAYDCKNISVSGGGSERCSSNPNTRVGTVENRVESLKPSLAIDEVESRSTVTAQVAND